jgi:hypothetical protein
MAVAAVERCDLFCYCFTEHLIVPSFFFYICVFDLQSLPQRFYGKEPNQIYKEITRFSKHFPKVAFPKHFSKSASSILLGLLHPIPDQRLGNLSGVSALGLLLFVVVVVDRCCVSLTHLCFCFSFRDPRMLKTINILQISIG